MTDLDTALIGTSPEPATAVSTVTPRKCRRHEYAPSGMSCTVAHPPGEVCPWSLRRCTRCGKPEDPVASRRSRNNGKRGRAAELDMARAVGGRKVGPLGHPWDVEMPGYSRLQIKKLATPPSLRLVAKWMADIARTPGPEMPGVVWIEPGRGGERLIVFRLADFADRHGVPDDGAAP